MDDLRFGITAHYNTYVAAGATRIDAVLTVTAEPVGPPRRVSVAQVLLIDRSGSMEGARIRAARKAASAAVAALPDGTLFAVVGGGSDARNVYPRKGLATADSRTRSAAVRAVRTIAADSGTAMSTWLAAAERLLRGCGAEVRHAILLTDGQNTEPDGRLEKILDTCRGAFTCDARGVGRGWSVHELRLIAGALDGTADALIDPDALAAEFTALTEAAVSRIPGKVVLRLKTPSAVSVVRFGEVWPEVRELLPGRPTIAAGTTDHPAGPWRMGSRDYELTATVPPGALDEEHFVARVSVLYDGDVRAQAMITAERTEDRVKTAAMDPRVAHYRGQQELADSIRAGLAAHRVGDTATAVAELGRAVKLATASGNTEALATLSGLVDVQDAAAGRVRMARAASSAAADVAELRAARSVRAQPNPPS